MLAVLELGRNIDPFRSLAGAIFERIFECEVDEAADLLAIPDRNLSSDQRRHAHRLESGQKIADSAMRLVDPVDENEVRDAELVERSKGGRGERCARWIGVYHQDRDVGDGESLRAVCRESDRSGAIEEAKLSPR